MQILLMATRLVRVAGLGTRMVTLLAQTTAATAVPAADSASDPSAATEVVVHGSLPSRDAGSDRLQAQDTRGIPGTFGEPLQAVESLPGVSPMVSGLPYFYVRGAPPGNTGYFIDGVPLPALFHLGPGPSVVPPQLLDRIDFFPSNAPARYGRFAGGVVAAETTDPSPVARGEASVRLFDSSAFVETPFDDGRSTFLAAGRYGYLNFLLSVFAPNLKLGYGDYTTRVTHAFSGADSISLFAIGGYDHEEDTSQDLPPISTQFHRVDLRYDHRWSTGSLRLATTFGYDVTSDLAATQANETVTSVSGRLRLELEQRLGDNVRVSAGADANGMRSIYAIAGAPLVAPMLTQVGGAYVDVRLRPTPWVEISPGVRADVYQWPHTSAASVDPKLTTRIRLSPALTWISTFGIADQPPTYPIPIPGYQMPPTAGLQRSYEMSEGVEAPLPFAMKARLTGFYSSVHNVSDFVSDCGTFAEACNITGLVDGRNYGLEAFLERALSERFGGWISYTLSRAERRSGEVPYLSPFDRTHVLSVVARYAFANDVSAGVRGTYYTGRPDFPTFAYGAATTFSVAPGQIAQHRLPPFYRLDARVDKRWNLPGGRWLTGVVEFFDATLSKEAIDFRCQLLTGQCVAQQVGPIALPSIGLEGGF
jgi:hypothetical protein